MSDIKARKADQKAMEELHEQIAKLLLEKVKSKQILPAELAVAIRFLKDNNITGLLEDEQLSNNIKEILTELPYPNNRFGT